MLNKNSHSLLLSSLILVFCAGCTVTTGGTLAIKNVRFASSKDASTVREKATFKPGESAFILFDVTDAKKDGSGKVHVQEDLSVKDPGGKVIFEKKNLVDFNEDAKGGSTLNLDNNLDLPASFPGGNYSVTMTVRDLNAGNATTATSSSSLTVEAGAPATGQTPAPSQTPE